MRPGDAATVLLRFVTGVMLAGVYPIGMKMAAGWTERAMGLMIGVLVGALTLDAERNNAAAQALAARLNALAPENERGWVATSGEAGLTPDSPSP